MINDTITKVKCSLQWARNEKRTNTKCHRQKVNWRTHTVVEMKLNIQHYRITWYLHFMTNPINQTYHIFSHESFRVFCFCFCCCLAFIRFQSIYYIFITFRWIFATWELVCKCVYVRVSANEYLFRWKYSMEQRSDIIMSQTRQRLMDGAQFLE